LKFLKYPELTVLWFWFLFSFHKSWNRIWFELVPKNEVFRM
jgi:hypothetical protein